MDAAIALIALITLMATYMTWTVLELDRLNQAIMTRDGWRGAKPAEPRRAYGVWIGTNRDPSGHPTFVLFAATDGEARARALGLAAGRTFTIR